jgi:hypothetical protein
MVIEGRYGTLGMGDVVGNGHLKDQEDDWWIT